MDMCCSGLSLACCRSLNDSQQITQDHQNPSLILKLSKKVARGTERVHQDVHLSVQDLAAWLCPAALQQLYILVNETGTDPHPAGFPGMHPCLSRCKVLRELCYPVL